MSVRHQIYQVNYSQLEGEEEGGFGLGGCYNRKKGETIFAKGRPPQVDFVPGIQMCF